MKKIDLSKERYLLFVDTETIGSLFTFWNRYKDLWYWKTKSS